ncbi:transglycosylase domain-containing protein [Clostridium sp.]|uniref:transglycosylase domain-containing protein n=1 Tax=Clostridium sp. TaxID=1506 RepID=UPI003464AA3F
MGKRKKQSKKKGSPNKVWKKILLGFVFFTLLIGIGLAGISFAIVKTAPPLDINALLSLNEDSTLYDSNGEFMDYVPTEQKRSIVSIDDMSQYLKDAFVSIEDERFYSHNGLDYRRILGAVYIDVKNKITGQIGLHGASTITQQLLKNTLLTNEVTLQRKIQEMYMALKLEKALTKDQILEAYLNTIHLGGRANGVEAAAKQYFNKSAKDLDLIESAYIAGVTQNPSRFYPFSPSAKKDPSPYINKTKLVLEKMKELNKISEEEYNNAIADINANGIKFNPPKQDTDKLNFEWFSRPVMTQVKKDLKTKYGYTDKEVDRMLNYGGLKIYTTMDRNLQTYSQNEVVNKASSFTSIGNVKDEKTNLIQPQISAVVMDYSNGQVKTIIGGRGDQPALSFNRAASNKYLKSVGSAIKPLTVYAPLIDTQIATAGTVLEDSPLPDDSVRNYDKNDFKGYLTLREGLQRSQNTIAAKSLNLLGYGNSLDYGKKFGLIFNEESRGQSALALGEFDNRSNDLDGGNPLIVSAAYGTFGNEGKYTEPMLYTEVKDRNGNVILDGKPKEKQIVSKEAAYITYDMLKGVVTPPGTGGRAKFGSMPVAGKTGTSSDNKNLWFAGLTPYYSAAVWIGDDFSKPVKGSSGDAATIWSKIMAKAHEGLAYKDISAPSGVVTVDICKDSGKLPTDLCARDPRGGRVYSELFISGTQPTSLCDVHVEAKVNKSNGKLATENTPADLIESRVFIKRNYVPSVYLQDQPYVLPTAKDDTTVAPTVPEENTTEDENNGGEENQEQENPNPNPVPPITPPTPTPRPPDNNEGNSSSGGRRR